jgi:ribosomal protein L11 methyltransferase
MPSAGDGMPDASVPTQPPAASTAARSWPAIELDPGTTDPDLIQAALVDFAVVAIDDTIPHRWLVFFQSATERDRAGSALLEAFTGVTLHPIEVPDDDWAARSQASLCAIRVRNIIVAPPWDVPAEEVARTTGGPRQEPIVIVIQPSMGFGTGHHATTRLCLEALQQIDLHGLGVIDVGTGSGVLALAASRLGAGPVFGIDDDVHAIAAAQESADLNPDARVTLAVTDFRSAPTQRFDVVIGNLTGGLLIAGADHLEALVGRDGCLVLSGFMAHEEAEVRRAFAGDVEWSAQEDEWRCVRIRARS